MAVAAAAVAAGAAVNTAIQDSRLFGTRCTMIIENHSTFELVEAKTHLNNGNLNAGPTSIKPGGRIQFVAVDAKASLTETAGIVSWKFKRPMEGNLGKGRICVMWSIPVNQIMKSNYLAVGITDAIAFQDEWFDQMYYNNPTTTFKIQQEKYTNDIKEINVSKNGISVSGTMGTNADSVVTIIVTDY